MKGKKQMPFVLKSFTIWVLNYILLQNELLINCELITEEFCWLFYGQDLSEIDSASALIFSRSWNREQIKNKEIEATIEEKLK